MMKLKFVTNIGGTVVIELRFVTKSCAVNKAGTTIILDKSDVKRYMQQYPLSWIEI